MLLTSFALLPTLLLVTVVESGGSASIFIISWWCSQNRKSSDRTRIELKHYWCLHTLVKIFNTEVHLFMLLITYLTWYTAFTELRKLLLNVPWSWIWAPVNTRMWWGQKQKNIAGHIAREFSLAWWYFLEKSGSKTTCIFSGDRKQKEGLDSSLCIFSEGSQNTLTK